MTDPHSAVSDYADRLDQVLGSYLATLELDQVPDPTGLIARHPDLAEELSAFFADQERADHWTAPLRSLAKQALASVVAAEATPWPSHSSDSLPASFGNYELLAGIGRGGMGVVYRARQKNLNRVVALKMIRAGALASPDDLRRFRNEAEAAAKLDHPHVVPVYEVGEYAAQQYFTMKLIDGGSLDQQLARYTADPKAAARLVATVARAVHHAHQRGVLHRDLKPSNILLDAQGQPHVSDFGLAKRLQVDGGMTQTGAIVGSPSYMAPEQATGAKGTISTATDVYGLGAVLYALLTGQPPFRGDSLLTTLDQVRRREPDSPSDSNRRVDRDLESICLKCLEKEPERRYSSAEALADDLSHWLEGEPIQARRTGPMVRLWRWGRRNPLVATLSVSASALLAALILGSLLSFILVWKQQQETRRALAIADRNTRAALDVVNDMLERLQIDEGIAASPAGRKAREDLHSKAIALFEAIAATDEHFEETRGAAGDCYLHMTGVYDAFGRSDEAEESVRKAIAYHERSAARFPRNVNFLNCVGTAHGNLGLRLWVAGRHDEATAEFIKARTAYHRAMVLEPEDLMVLRYHAWLWAICPAVEFRQPASALEAAEKLIRLQPERAKNYRILGVTRYRAGHWQEAIDALEEALRRDGTHAADWFFLAMAHHQLKHQQQARESFSRAIGWMSRSVRRDSELFLFRAEAARVLGIEEPRHPAVQTTTSPKPNRLVHRDR
jgi:serine/threonine-protein kinase